MGGTTSQGGTPLRATTVAILHRNRLDCDALEFLVSSRGRYQVVGTAMAVHAFTEVCNHEKPEIAIFDASFPFSAGDVFLQAQILTCSAGLHRVLFIDEFPNWINAKAAMGIRGSGYVTRQRTGERFLEALDELAKGHPPLDGFAIDWLHTEEGLEQRLQTTSPRLATLSPREFEVFQLLAQGQGVSSCAKILQLAQSTVEKHKTRIMRKLGVTKAVQLIHVAIREGVIVL